MGIGERTQGYAATLYNLAQAVESLGQIQRAVELYNHVLNIQQECSGQNSSEYVASLNSLANAIEKQGDATRAAELYKQVAATAPDFAANKLSTAQTMEAQGEHNTAAEFYNQALKIQAVTVGKSSPDYEATLKSLQRVVEACGDVDMPYNQATFGTPYVGEIMA